MIKLVKNWPKRLVKNIFSTACMLLLYHNLLQSYGFDFWGIERRCCEVPESTARGRGKMELVLPVILEP